MLGLELFWSHTCLYQDVISQTSQIKKWYNFYYSVEPDDLSLRMGEYDLNGEKEPHGFLDRKVQIVASHPKFDPKTFEYDLALLRFYEPVKFSPNIIPICVPETTPTSSEKRRGSRDGVDFTKVITAQIPPLAT